jgi:hypothetical protein
MIEQMDEIWTKETIDEDQWPLVELAPAECRFCQVRHIWMS